MTLHCGTLPAPPDMRPCAGCQAVPVCRRWALPGQERCLRCHQQVTPRPSALRPRDRDGQAAFAARRQRPGAASQIALAPRVGPVDWDRLAGEDAP